jgi:glycosyltransferase involved in cell wall biosynthesis
VSPDTASAALPAAVQDLVEAPDPELIDPAVPPPTERPSLSVVVPAYNEALILMPNLTTLYAHLRGLDEQYDWELIVVNDGSTDETGDIADAFAKSRPEVRVLHHKINFNLGQALRYAFGTCRGDYVVTLDCDLSYSPDHIEKMLGLLRSEHAKVAVASPYAKGGHTSKIPFVRRMLSWWANRFLAAVAEGDLSTFTGMVRAYDRRFLSTLDLKAMGTDINTEILFKAQMLGARIVEVPAHLDWSTQQNRRSRTNSLKVRSSTTSYAFAGFLFRPVAFFVVPGMVLLALATYTLTWVLYNTFLHYQELQGSLDPRFSAAVAQTFEEGPHAFVVGGISLLLAVQLLSLGILASQSKRYFEEMFHLTTSVFREQIRNNGEW